MRSKPGSLSQQLFQYPPINAGEPIQFLDADALIDLMDAGVDRAQFHHLGPGGGDEAAVGGAPGGGGFWPIAHQLLHRHRNGLDQIAGGRQEGFAGQAPGEFIVESAPVQDGSDPAPDGVGIQFRGKAQVELGGQGAGDHVLGPGARVEVGNLEGGGRKKGVALVPFLVHQCHQAGSQGVQGVEGAVGVGYMALLADNLQKAAEAAPAAILEGIAEALVTGGLAHQTPVDLFPPGLQGLDHPRRAIDGGAFLVAGDEKGNGAGMVRMVADKVLGRGHHGRDLALHVAGATAIKEAVTDLRLKGVRVPVLPGTGRNHVGVTGETEKRRLVPPARPEIGHLVKGQGLDAKAMGRQAPGDQVLTAPVLGGDGGAPQQFLGQGERGGHEGKISA